MLPALPQHLGVSYVDLPFRSIGCEETRGSYAYTDRKEPWPQFSLQRLAKAPVVGPGESRDRLTAPTEKRRERTFCQAPPFFS